MTTTIQTPRIVDLDPLQQIILELRVMNLILAQALDIDDDPENLRASVYVDLMSDATLTTGAP